MARRKPRGRGSRRGRERTSPEPPRRAGKPKKSLVALGLAILVAVGLAIYVTANQRAGAGHIVDVRVPELSGLAQQGARAFETSCASCHGPHAGGTENGPPLVHRIYEPSHHGDSAIRLAARLGVRPHHWRFGEMPKVEVSDRALDGIVAYVRELQRANGIH